jgi:amidohydrolase
MDALPIQEVNEVDYRSQNPGLMHACGHDAHTAILLGVATMLSQMERPPGEVRFLFQPCEEGSVCRDAEGYSGAGRMVQDCALEGLDAVIALHVASEAPVGIVAIDDGYIAAASDSFTATIKGKGGHGAYPHQSVDPIFMLGQVINIIQGIRSRKVNPMQPAVITIASVHAGDAANVIPAEVKLGGTIRSFSEEIRNQLHAELENALAVTRAMGGDYTL